MDSPERPAHAARSDDGVVGQHPGGEKPFQRRLMELAAGFAEHIDVQVGRLVDEIDRLGYGENTLILYIWGDNGSSAEGQDGTISELLAQNGIPTTVEQHLKALEALGGMDVLGSRRRPIRCTTRVGAGREARRTRERSSLPRTSAERAIHWSCAGRRRSSRTRRRARNSTTSTMSCRRSTKWSASRRRAWSMASSRIPSTA